MDDLMDDYLDKDIVAFGGGCFWCTEAVFKMLKGVLAVDPGYSGGNKENPNYEEVCAGETGHAEVVRITYNPKVISFNDLLTVFFATHDPTSLNKQGNDVGEQYRSIILYTTPEQKTKAKNFIDELNGSAKAGKPIVTEVMSLFAFYDAENSHKDYYKNHPEAAYCQVVINPKLKKVQKKFANLLKNL